MTLQYNNTIHDTSREVTFLQRSNVGQMPNNDRAVNKSSLSLIVAICLFGWLQGRYYDSASPRVYLCSIPALLNDIESEPRIADRLIPTWT